MMQLHQADDEKEALRSWSRTLHAMHVLGFSDGEVSAVCAVLAAIYHLGIAGAVIGIHFLLFVFNCPWTVPVAKCVFAKRMPSVHLSIRLSVILMSHSKTVTFCIPTN